MRRRTFLLTAAVMGGFALVGCSDYGPTAPDTSVRFHAAPDGGARTYSGRATVVAAQVPLLGVDTRLADAGPLPESGGADEATLLEASVDGLLTARVLHASTVGQGSASRSEASVADLDLEVAGNSIQAAFLRSWAVARCSDGSVVLDGGSEIARLVVNGEEIAVTGAPNQEVAIPGGRVVINEQHRSEDAIEVNALHVIVPGTADIVISHAHADIQCGLKCPAPVGDFVTGGGWIDGPNGRRANFGVGGGIKHDAFWGHLTYIDHGNGLKVKGVEVTGYEVTGSTSRRIDGIARVDGQEIGYRVDVADNGEPGRDDTFRLELETGYVASGALRGGNIQLHPRPSDCP